MTPQEFAAKVRTKYPQGVAADGRAYADIPDDELTKKIVEKYPVYASQIKQPPAEQPSMLQAAKENITKKLPSELGDIAMKVGEFFGLKPLAQGLGLAAANATGNTNAAEDAQKKLLTNSDTLYAQYRDAKAKGDQANMTRLLDAMKANDQSLIEAGKRIENVGTDGLTTKQVLGSAVSTVALSASAGLAAPEALLGKVAQGAAVGGVNAAANSAAKGGTNEDIATSGLQGAAGGGFIPVAGEGVRQLGKLLGKVGDKIQFSVIKPTQADIKDGFSIETVKKYGLGGSLKASFEKTDSRLDQLSKELNNKLAASNASLDLNKVYEDTVKKLLGNKFENFGSNTSMEKAIEQLKNEIVGVSGPNGAVSIPEAQTIKRAAGHFGAWVFGARDPDSTARERVYNAFYSQMKDAIEKNSPPGVREINKQLSELIPVMNALIRRIPVAERNSALSLPDVISMTAATIEPRALALTLANLASRSGTVGAALSKTGGKVAGFAAPKAGAVARTVATAALGSKSQAQSK